MERSNLYKQLKDLVYGYTGSNGEILRKPRGVIADQVKDEDINVFLQEFVGVILNSDYFCMETKLYLKNYYITYNGIVSELKDAGVAANINTVKSKLWHDRAKLVKHFGERVLLDLVVYGKVENLSYYRESLNRVKEKYAMSKFLQLNIALKLPSLDNSSSVVSVNKEDFNEFIGIVAPYCKSHMEYISNNIDKNVVGYCRYLLDNDIISDEDKENKEILMQILGLRCS